MRHLFFAIALVSVAAPAMATERLQGPSVSVLHNGEQFSMDRRGADYTIVKVGIAPLSRRTADDVHTFVASCTKAIVGQTGTNLAGNRVHSRRELQILAGHCVDFYLGSAIGRDPSFQGVSVLWRR